MLKNTCLAIMLPYSIIRQVNDRKVFALAESTAFAIKVHMNNYCSGEASVLEHLYIQLSNCFDKKYCF